MEIPFKPDNEGYVTGDVELIAELTWEGLQRSVVDGFRTQLQAEELFFTWFKEQE